MASGHVEKRGKKWQVVLDLGYDDKGKRIRKYVQPKCESERLAKKLLIMKLAEIERGEYIDPDAGKVTVATHMKQWLDLQTHIKETTKENYEIIINSRIVPFLGSYELGKLTPLHVEQFKKHLLKKGRADGKGGLSARSVEYTLTILNSALESAVDWDLILKNPARKVKKPKGEGVEVKPFSLEQTNKIFEVVRNERMYAAFVVLLATGIRRGELLGLRRKDILWKENKIWIRQTVVRRKNGVAFSTPKTKKSIRKITVSDNVMNVLREHLKRQNDERLEWKEAYQDHDLVFCRENGDPINPSTFTRYFLSTVMPRAGITRATLGDNEKYDLHSLRHTTATLLLRRGTSLKQIQELLGHSTITTTANIYTEVASELEEAAAQKLDELLFA